MRRAAVIASFLMASVATVASGHGAPPAPAAAPSSPLDALRFLVGTWQGEGGGQPGQGGGKAAFTLDLDGRVLVRRGHSEYPAAAGKPAVVHDDLMVVHPAPGGRTVEAMYFDNEGHVVEYSVEVSKDGAKVVFLSELQPAAPRFRLTYARVAGDVVDVTFEIAPPGAPEAFKPYVSGRTRRSGP